MSPRAIGSRRLGGRFQSCLGSSLLDPLVPSDFAQLLEKPILWHCHTVACPFADECCNSEKTPWFQSSYSRFSLLRCIQWKLWTGLVPELLTFKIRQELLQVILPLLVNLCSIQKRLVSHVNLTSKALEFLDWGTGIPLFTNFKWPHLLKEYFQSSGGMLTENCSWGTTTAGLMQLQLPQL